METYAEDFGIDYLRSTLIKETKYFESLKEHCTELAAAIAELDEQKQKDYEQGSEWKTRFEIQQEINDQLRKHRIVLDGRVARAARQTHDVQRSSRTNASPVAFGEALTDSLLDELEKTKQALMTQLLNMELRIEQEAKAYHKANEERKAVHLEIGGINAKLSSLKGTAASSLATGMADEDPNLTVSHVDRKPAGQSAKSGVGGSGGIGPKNIPQNQRVLDPKLGPIKKVAAVKQLPPL